MYKQQYAQIQYCLLIYEMSDIEEQCGYGEMEDCHLTPGRRKQGRQRVHTKVQTDGTVVDKTSTAAAMKLAAATTTGVIGLDQSTVVSGHDENTDGGQGSAACSHDVHVCGHESGSSAAPKAEQEKPVAVSKGRHQHGEHAVERAAKNHLICSGTQTSCRGSKQKAGEKKPVTSAGNQTEVAFRNDITPALPDITVASMHKHVQLPAFSVTAVDDSPSSGSCTTSSKSTTTDISSDRTTSLSSSFDSTTSYSTSTTGSTSTSTLSSRS